MACHISHIYLSLLGLGYRKDMPIEIVCDKCGFIIYRLGLYAPNKRLGLDNCLNCKAKLSQDGMEVEVERLV